MGCLRTFAVVRTENHIRHNGKHKPAYLKPQSKILLLFVTLVYDYKINICVLRQKDINIGTIKYKEIILLQEA